MTLGARWLPLAAAMLLAACAKDGENAGSSGAAGVPPADAMSVLLLTVDTLRPDYLSMYGYDRPTTPYLDELFAEGYHFPRAVTPIARTTPALASMLAGAYPHATGVRRLHHAWGPGTVSLAEVLQDAGWQTLAVVTNRVITPERKLDRGFEVYDMDIDLRAADKHEAAAVARLEALDGARPFLAWVHYIDPHMPYDASPEIAREFDPDYRGRYQDSFGTWTSKEKLRKKFEHRGPYPDDLPTPRAVHQNPLPDNVNAHIRRLYAADIRFVDDHVRGVVEKAYEKAGGNLLIVFSSDHGESLGEHDYYWFHGDYVYNADGRVPLAFLLPEDHALRGAGRSERWGSLVDIAPTVLDLVGLKAPALRAQFEGRSLAPALRGEALAARPVFQECGRAHHFKYVKGRSANTIAARFRAVTLGDWKLIWAPGQEKPEREWQLYHLAADPQETENLYAADHPRFLELRPILMEWAAQGIRAGDNEEEMTPEEIDILNEVGYVTDGNG